MGHLKEADLMDIQYLHLIVWHPRGGVSNEYITVRMNTIQKIITFKLASYLEEAFIFFLVLLNIFLNGLMFDI